nr:PH domain-containing protein [Sphaerisporangium rubeum]
MAPSLLLPLAGVLFVGGFAPSSFMWALVAVAASIGFAALRWATTTYQVVADRLEITRSLISRSVRSIPLDRVRGVDVSTPPLHRLLGLAVVKVDTGAGGDKQEGELNGVSVAEAERLRAVLLRRSRAVRSGAGAHSAARGAFTTETRTARPGAGPGQAPDHPSGHAQDHLTGPVPGHAPGHAQDHLTGPVPGHVQDHPPDHLAGHVPDYGLDHVPDHVYARVPKSWARYGPFSATYLLTPFVLLGGAIGLVFQWGENLGVNERAAWNVAEWLWHRPVLLAVIAVVLVLISPLAACVMYAVFNWDFTLLRRDASLVAERGLINRRSVSLEHARIRGYEFAEGLLERIANVGRLWAVVTGLGDSRTRGQLLPTGPKDFVLGVAAEAVAPFTATLAPHPPAARRRRLFRAVALPLVLAAVAFAFGLTWLGLAGLVLAVLCVPLGLDRYRSLGHAYDGSRLSVRSGTLPRSQAVIERRAVVGWTIRQTMFQRQAKVLTVIAGVGAGSGGYPAVDTGEHQGVHFAATVTPDWLAPFVTTAPPAAPSDNS